MGYVMKKKEKSDQFGIKHKWTEVTFTAKTISELWKEIDNFVDSEKCRRLSFGGDDYGHYRTPSYDRKKWKLVMTMNMISPA